MNTLDRFLARINDSQYEIVLQQIAGIFISFPDIDIVKILNNPAFVTFTEKLRKTLSLTNCITIFLYLDGKEKYLFPNHNKQDNKKPLIAEKFLSHQSESHLPLVIESLLEKINYSQAITTNHNETSNQTNGNIQNFLEEKQKYQVLPIEEISKMSLQKIEKNLELVTKSLEFYRSGDLSKLNENV